MEYLGMITSGSPRKFLPSLERRDVGDDVLCAELQNFRSDRPTVDTTQPESFPCLETLEPWPVSGLLCEGEPVHPPGIHQEGGYVKTTRLFGGDDVDQEFVRRMLTYRSYSEIRGSLKTIYTRGTGAGFVSRLTTLTTRAVPLMTESLKLNRRTIIRRLKDLLPVDLSVLERSDVTWRDDLATQLDHIKTSSISTAGAPYWVPKPQALAKMIKVVLPLVHRAISEGKLGQLFREQPELFLGEVKNKLDRYSRDKLNSKTRPYFSLPFHFQALFSMMSQPFTHAMEKFYDGMGSNAYGMSWAHGGCEKLARWAREARELTRGGRPRFCSYGDDTDIYVRYQGRLLHIAPDFVQMDGSVDSETVEATIDYVVETLSAAWGENDFFREVAELWKEFALDPAFLLRGTTVYRKPQRNGLMTGVVGTTLFDTAKSVLAYDAWADEVAAGRRDLLEAEPAARYFQEKFGLIVKEGTWSPQPVQETPTVDSLWSEAKFLGVYLMYTQGPTKTELVPYLPEEDWVDLIMNPRDNPKNFKKGRPKESQHAIARRWYDRMRGYMVTGAFSNPLVERWIGGFVNDLDPVPISMSVMANKGTGESPGVPTCIEEDFHYPDSSGFPSREWCQNLYFSEENQWEDAQWIKLLPEVESRLQEFRSKHKAMTPRMTVLEASKKHPELGGKVLVAQQTLELDSKPPLEVLLEDAVPMDPISGGPIPALRGSTPNPRSKIVSYSKGALSPKERKRIPTAAATVAELFKTEAAPIPFPRGSAPPSPLWEEVERNVRSGITDARVWRTPVLSLGALADRLGRSLPAAAMAAREAGLYVLGCEEKYVTKIPWYTANRKVGKQLMKQMQENRERAKVVSATVDLKIKALKHSTLAQGISTEVAENPRHRPCLGHIGWNPDPNPIVSLNGLFQASALVMGLRNRNVQEENVQKTETTLSWKCARGRTPEDWYLSIRGQSARANAQKLLDYITQKYELSGITRQVKTLPAEKESWAEQVEAEERAKLFDSTGLHFTVRGQFLHPARDLGPWLETDSENRALLGGVLWKQRKGETLTAYLERSKKRLKTYGLSLEHESLTTLKPPSSKKKKNRDAN